MDNSTLDISPGHSLALDIPLNILPCTFLSTIPPGTFHPDILLPWTFPTTFSPVHSCGQFHPGHFTRTFSCPGHSPENSPLYIPVDNSTPDISPGHSLALDIPLNILPCTFLWTILAPSPQKKILHLDILPVHFIHGQSLSQRTFLWTIPPRTFSCPGHSPEHSPLYIPLDNFRPSPQKNPYLDILPGHFTHGQFLP